MLFSLLDLSPITDSNTVAEALSNSADLARHAEGWGYHRFWLAEHHNSVGIASAATAVSLCNVGNHTSTMRIGSGGIMLPNHAPYIVAEQFGTLEALFPGRVDLGLGRAPGTDGATLRALRREYGDAERFPQDVQELLGYLAEAEPTDRIKAVPGYGQDIPVWILGSSNFGAQLAAQMGLPYAFASHFAPDYLHQALQLYRQEFRPSRYLQAPYAMAAMNVFAADSRREAQRMMTSMQQQFLSLRKGMPERLQAPVDDISLIATPQELAGVHHALACTAVGEAQEVGERIQEFVEATGIDELMLTCHAWEHTARLRSLEIAAEACAALPAAQTGQTDGN